jgi:butyryl-CoA dehydrogenase
MAIAGTNPLLDDRDVEVLLDEVLDLGALLRLPYFADHDRAIFSAVIAEARRFGRDVLYPSYRELDHAPPRLVDGRVVVHPRMHELWRQMVALDLVAGPRPHAVGGQQLPLVITTLATAYLMAGNCAAYGYVGLTQGAAHLIEAFGDATLRDEVMARMYRGEWTGTMALTEPQAGSSLADVTTIATPTAAGHYLIRGSKIFISGGDHDFADNVVHMTLARIAGAPAGIKGVSLFCVPKRRLEAGALVDNDVAVAGVIHKIGWRGLPSLALNYGERDDCHGWLVGEPHRGISYMFQMMNEARLMVGLNGVATASVAYQEAVAYARTRPQGRPLAAKDPATAQVPIIAHADVRRMLLRQRAIVTGGLALLVKTAWYADVAGHGEGAARARAGLLLDLLTPIAKSFPAERGFEANALAVQVHGGYGYSSEYPVEAWLRDQKLNSIHEGTSGIQALDLLGRRAVAGGGAALRAWIEEVAATCGRAVDAGVEPGWIDAVRSASEQVGALTMTLAARGLGGDPDGMLLHAADYLELFAIAAVAWQWLELAAVAHRGLAGGPTDARAAHYRMLRAAAQYWIATEVPRIAHLAQLCASGEDSYGQIAADDF